MIATGLKLTVLLFPFFVFFIQTYSSKTDDKMFELSTMHQSLRDYMIQFLYIRLTLTCVRISTASASLIDNPIAYNSIRWNELGRLSLNLQITMNIFKFWIHLENQSSDSIAKLCLNISNKMAEENKSGLINKINLLSTQLSIHKQSVNFENPSTFLSKADLSKRIICQNIWKTTS